MVEYNYVEWREQMGIIALEVENQVFIKYETGEPINDNLMKKYKICMKLVDYLDYDNHDVQAFQKKGMFKIVRQEPLINVPYKYMDQFKKEYCEFYDIKYIQEKPLKCFYWLTLTGKDRIPDTQDNIDKMYEFGKTLFNNNKYKRFYKVIWNIETGKYKENPNLHLHALIIFEKSNKNFHTTKMKGRSDVKSIWNKYFKSYGLDLGKDSYQIFRGKNIDEIYKDKKEYLTNKDKSILHQNYRDLEILEHVEHV